MLIDDAFSRGLERGGDRRRRVGDVHVQDCRDCLGRMTQQRGSEQQDQACLRLREIRYERKEEAQIALLAPLDDAGG